MSGDSDDSPPWEVGRVMAAHDGVHGHPFGPDVFVLVASNGSVYGPWRSIGGAVAARYDGLGGSLKPEWLEVERVPVGALRIRDLRVRTGGV